MDSLDTWVILLVKMEDAVKTQKVANLQKIPRGRVFSTVEKRFEEYVDKFAIKICIFVAMVITVVKNVCKAWAFRKAEEDFNIFSRNFQRILLGTRLTDNVSKNKLGENCSILLSTAIMKENLRWLATFIVES